MGKDNTAPRQMTLVAFLQAAPTAPTIRRPGAILPRRRLPHGRLLSAHCSTLEEGKFHLAFCDDRLAMPDRYGDDFATAVQHGIRIVKMDLIPVLTAMGLATRYLGLGATYSTTYYEPFHVARVFATLDHLLGGRVAWNVVTSLNDSEASNFGQGPHPDHDTRYDRADEFMEVVLGHWDSWEDDALVYDRTRGLSPIQRRCIARSTGASGSTPAARLPCRVLHRAPGHYAGGAQWPGPPVCSALGRTHLHHWPNPDFGRDVRRAIQEEAVRYG